ncbi:NifU family protein [Helicobacter turcicus]|uniref:NifU family protein n=1 Tax=Helicobacter turcicus TaxID=2867412 RepID=A0ABS7JNK6_9HELI|nr:NifU family protein [Helicobacter turcicus]MBX7490939.1 NifU family protein [Helicobacter turcicus]MBX7545793.1 NifU family protein [Helicobacter turcicus]
MLPFSDTELLKPVEASIDKVRPMLIKDGGNVTLIKIENGKVYVRLEGACKGCPSSAQTLKFGIEHTLKNDIHPDIEIISIS